MSLLNYLPRVLKENREFKEIMQTEDDELSVMNNEVENIKKETIINEASEVGISRYEKILGIKDNIGLNIEERRLIVKNLFMNRAPFTVRWLSNKLESICGKDNYDIVIDYEKFSINIQIGYLFQEATEELRKDLINIIPANLNLLINFWYIETLTIKQSILVKDIEYVQIRQIN